MEEQKEIEEAKKVLLIQLFGLGVLILAIILAWVTYGFTMVIVIFLFIWSNNIQMVYSKTKKDEK